jgi:hypothetical protein
MRSRITAAITASVLSLTTLATTAAGQAPIAALTLGPDQIGVVRTAPGITTRISFPEKISETVCGDLYDPATGNGAFVVQMSGNDLFLKPVASKGASNLFVKVGEDGKTTYNFDLLIVAAAQAHRVVNVASSARGDRPGTPAASRDTEAHKAELARARKQADDLLSAAREQANRMVAEAEARIAEADRLAARRAQQESERRFAYALMLGLRETKINNPRVVARKVVVTLDPRALTFNEKTYLRYTIQNSGESPFSFSSIALEASSGGGARPLSVELVQSKADNNLAPGESLAGVIVFDAKSVGAKDKLTLYVRGEDNAEIAQVAIQ